MTLLKKAGARFGIVALSALVVTTGCFTTVAEHRKLEKKVIDLQRQGGGGGERLANVAAEVDELKAELRALRGQLDEVQRLAEEGVREARKARREAAGGGGAAGGPESGAGASSGRASQGGVAALAGPGESDDSGAGSAPLEAVELSQELRDYQAGMAAWRAGEHQVCIDRFREFLQTYASSSRADDAAFWMADCHYKQGEFKNAVLRFDDVVRNYPSGNKAPDALYRQGESLMKLGPGYHQAARKAFERVLREYPDSARAEQAKRKLELQAAGGAG